MKKNIRIVDKENQFIIKQKQILSNPINDKMIKFGKTIRAKLSQKPQTTNPRASQPLQETNDFKNTNSVILNSQNLPILDDISKMSVSYISHENNNKQTNRMLMSCTSRSNLSKSKSVRFCDLEDSSSLSLNKSIKKSQSILKNSNSSEKLSSNSTTSHVGSISGGLSIKASLKDKGVNCENKNYESTMKILVYHGKKFFDDMFPPGGASLFHSSDLSSSKKEIRWMRVEQLFRNQKLVLYSHVDRNKIKTGQFSELNYMATCFNALGTSRRCLERIFQKQQLSKYGLYYLRLNHEGIWKYTIVDDYIPVRQVGKNYQPVFMNVCPPKSGYMQIWPFILQKALAKMYSTYQSLFNDDVQNLMQQLTGTIFQKITLSSQFSESNELKIKNYLINKDNIFLAYEPVSNLDKLTHTYYALQQNTQTKRTYFSQQTELRIIEIQKQKQVPSFNLQNIHSYFKNILLYIIDDSFYSVGCLIKQQKQSFSLRNFKIGSYGRCFLSVTQKDKKYFRNNGYKYCWMRIILVCKDLDGYRYINSAYANQKIVHIESILAPGQYFVLIHGQWNQKVYQVTLNYQGNVQTSIKRQPISKFPNIIEQMCRDIAQRFGSFVQLNKNVCSYQYKDIKNGLIIQNFNNQLDRQVYFHRIYQLPFKNFVNFGKAKFVQQENSNKKNNNYQLETFLQPDSNLTLVIMLMDGVNLEEFKQFKFPSS